MKLKLSLTIDSFSLFVAPKVYIYFFIYDAFVYCLF